MPPHLMGGTGSVGFASVLRQTYERIPAQVATDLKRPGPDSDLVVELGRVKAAVEMAIKLKNP